MFLLQLFPSPKSFFVQTSDDFNVIREEQFILVYSGNFTFLDTEAMGVRDRKFFINRLYNQKNEEKKAIEKANKGRK